MKLRYRKIARWNSALLSFSNVKPRHPWGCSSGPTTARMGTLRSVGLPAPPPQEIRRWLSGGLSADHRLRMALYVHSLRDHPF